MSDSTTIVKMQNNGALTRLQPAGRPAPTETPSARPMTEEEIYAAAPSDPDAQPLTPQDSARMKRTPRAKIVRRALGLSQEQFAARFHIPLETLRDWEQGRAQPDAPARAFLTVMAGNPEAVARALEKAR